MQPVAEREVRSIVPVDVEPVGIRVAALVAVRGTDEQQHRAPGGHGRPVVLHLAPDVPGDVGAGRLETQCLVDHVRNQGPIVHDLVPLIGVLAEHLAQPADEPARGLVPCAGDHLGVDECLRARQRPHLSLLVLELGGEQRGHQIVGRVLRPPVDVLREPGPADHAAFADLHGLARICPQRLVGMVVDRRLVLLRDAQEHADHARSASPRRGPSRSRTGRFPPMGRGTQRSTRALALRARSSASG